LADLELCGKWMPRAKEHCARRPLHESECRTAKALADNRTRKTERRVGQSDPAARSRWRQTYKLSRYGLTQADFDRLLELQGYACAMCHKPFAEGQPIFIDHDHACCPGEKSSCVRGLLELSCNASLGHIERRYEMARAYLSNPPARRVRDQAA
jgi:Recombination endonuclease VII